MLSEVAKLFTVDVLQDQTVDRGKIIQKSVGLDVEAMSHAGTPLLIGFEVYNMGKSIRIRSKKSKRIVRNISVGDDFPDSAVEQMAIKACEKEENSLDEGLEWEIINT